MNGSKRITIDNTLEERLRLLEDRVSSLSEGLVSATDTRTDATRDQERSVRPQREQKVLYITLCRPLFIGPPAASLITNRVHISRKRFSAGPPQYIMFTW